MLLFNSIFFLVVFVWWLVPCCSPSLFSFLIMTFLMASFLSYVTTLLHDMNFLARLLSWNQQSTMALIYFLFTIIFTIYLVAEYSLPPFGISFGCPPTMPFSFISFVSFEHLFHLLFPIHVDVFQWYCWFTSTYSLTHLPLFYIHILTFYNAHLCLSIHCYSSAHSHHCHSYWFVHLYLFAHSYWFLHLYWFVYLYRFVHLCRFVHLYWFVNLYWFVLFYRFVHLYWFVHSYWFLHLYPFFIPIGFFIPICTSFIIPICTNFSSFLSFFHSYLYSFAYLYLYWFVLSFLSLRSFVLLLCSFIMIRIMLFSFVFLFVCSGRITNNIYLFLLLLAFANGISTYFLNKVAYHKIS